MKKFKYNLVNVWLKDNNQGSDACDILFYDLIYDLEYSSYPIYLSTNNILHFIDIACTYEENTYTRYYEKL